MHASVATRSRIAPSAAQGSSAVAGFFAFESDRDGPGVLIPRPELHLVARFGAAARDGLDVYAFGVRLQVHRKLIRSGQRTVSVRLRLGAPDAVLGVRASEMTGRVVALEDLWGGPATRRLAARLSDAPDAAAAARVLEAAIAERLGAGDSGDARARFALAAADKLTHASVNAVADDLGVSERHLRRVFRETLGVSPKAFAMLGRFRRALHAARADAPPSWASIAALAGYYDQAHLIAEFRAIAGATPRALVGELRATPLVG